MVKMSDNDSLTVSQENDLMKKEENDSMTDDQGNLLRGIDIWSGTVYKGLKRPFDNSSKSAYPLKSLSNLYAYRVISVRRNLMTYRFRDF